ALNSSASSGRERAPSMSSTRSTKRPPRARARSCATIAEKAWPRCNGPFGLGAKRVTTIAPRAFPPARLAGFAVDSRFVTVLTRFFANAPLAPYQELARRVQGRTDRSRRAFPERGRGSGPQPRELPGAGAQRRLHAAVVLPAEPVAVADRDQGDLPRAGRRRRDVRAAGAFAVARHADPERDRAPAVREAERVSGVHPLQRVPARPLRLPVLRQPASPDIRPRD